MSRGTETRKRNHRLTVRFDEQEAAAIRELADRSGQSPGSLLRQALLNVPLPSRSVRRPSVEVQAVARLLGELAKIRAAINMPGSNINQIAKGVNMGRPVERYAHLLEENLLLIQECLRDLLELRHACLRAVGQEPASPDHDRHPPDPD